MSPTWEGPPPPVLPPLGPAERWRIAWRAPLIGAVVFGGLAVLLGLRLIERPLFGMDRPVTPRITQAVCRAVLGLLGLRVRLRGQPFTGAGAIVANHTSWLDIFVLNAQKTLYFVSKSEVAGWPGIGWLARATGTLFIERDRKAAAAQTALFEDRLLHGHRLLFFPEGTSTDGQQVLPFKTTLFAAFFSDRLKHDVQIQGLSVVYHAPPGSDRRFYGWWGDMAFGPSLLRVMAQRPQGQVDLIYHPALRVDDYPNRKSLASALEAQVRAGHADRLGE